MAVQLKPVEDQVIVITGASSGIGLATAQAAGAAGARVVLTSRSGGVLADVEKRIRDAGGEAIHVVADVGDRDQLQRVADAAISRFGGFDTWVNNAGVGIYGRLEEVSDEDSRKLFQTNFWGLVYGSFIAAEHLRENGGSIVNLGSVACDIGLPLQGMYAASKHAIKGFTDTFRVELEDEGAPISVTLIKPASINTPFVEHARNYTGRAMKLPPPTYAPEAVARAILHAAAHGGRDIYVGGAGRILSGLQKFAPRAMDMLGEKVAVGLQFRNGSAGDPDGNLNGPGQGGETWGDEPGYTMRTSLYTRASLHPAISGALVAAAGLATAALISAAGRRRL